MKLLTMLAATAISISAALSQPAGAANPAMWVAQDDDTRVVMLGTFHILPPETKWRTEAFESGFAEADIVYFEAETDAPDALSKTTSVVMTQGFNPDGRMLADMLTPEDAKALREIVTSLGLPIEGVNPMRPWYAFLTLSVQFIVQQGFEPGSGVDATLLAEARTKGKDIRFFETIEEQLELFTGLNPETELALLELTIRDWSQQAESFDGLFQAWKTADTDFIDAEMNEIMDQQAPIVFERLLVDRNKAWAEEIINVMEAETGTIFVAVGAAHLVGEQSVPSMLEAHGVKVSRYGDAATTRAANDNEDPIGKADDAGGAIAAENR